jgi:4-amino-4-deoxy-L-arabinose transferase-like glycosyltransferase
MSTLEEPAALTAPGGSARRSRAIVDRLARLAASTPWALCLITALAAALRFTELQGVAPNAFYDASVRSMSMSLHNFFFGAYDPGAILSIDKPPLDLWLQVISTKLLGWNNFALKLPEALAGTLAVPLLYDAVRRAAGRPAGLAAACALAVLPESVLTSRSDTMDSVMMLLVIAAWWLVIRGSQSGRRRTIVLAGVVMGIAFNVKLLQSLVPAPGLVVLYLLASRQPLRRRLTDLALAGAAYVVVALSWAVAVSVAPGHHPWAVGSSDGSVWNAMFVFNGVGKVGGSTASTKPGGPGIFRLVVSTGWHYDALFGCVLVAALAIGVGGVLAARWRPAGAGLRAAAGDIGLARAFAVSLAVWIAFAVLVYDTMVTVHARYLEALAPALAAAIGYGAVSIAGLRARRGAGRPSLALTLLVLVCACAYTFEFNPPSIGWGAASLLVASAGAVLIARAGSGALGSAGRWLTAGLIVASVLLFPVHESLQLVRTKANDSLGLAVAPPANTAALERFLPGHTAGVRYEVAVDEPLSLAPLLIDDRRAILPLTSFGGRPLTSVAAVQAAVRAGQVRYGLVDSHNCASGRHWAGCAPAALWIRRHGIDVTAEVGLTRPSHLYLLTPNSAA